MPAGRRTPLPPPTPRRGAPAVGNWFVVGDVIGRGSCAEVRRGVDSRTGEEVAIKLSEMGDEMLKQEEKVYRSVDGLAGFPRLRWAGDDGDSTAIVTDLLSSSAGAAGAVGVSKAITLGRQMLRLVRDLHSTGYVHRDLKPDNFLFGRQHPDQLHLIDFGLAWRFVDPETQEHMRYCEGRGFSGTPNFASVHAHMGHSPSRRDDVESLLYCILWLCKGALPWEGLGGRSWKERARRVGVRKNTLPAGRLTEGLPPQLTRWVEHVRGLDFSDEPDYGMLDAILADALRSCAHIRPPASAAGDSGEEEPSLCGTRVNDRPFTLARL